MNSAASSLSGRSGVRSATDQKALFIDRQFKESPDLETAVKRVVLLVLKSPRFLYRETSRGHPDSYDVASRLSFGLWDSLPDQILFDAAASGQLATRDQVVRQAERMIADPRARTKLTGFFLQWLKIDQARDIVKDPKLYPEFSETVVSDLRTSLDLFLDDVIGSRGVGLSPALAGQLRLPEWPAGATLRSQAAGGCTVSESFARAGRAQRPAHSSLLDGEFRLHGDELADSSRRFHCPQRSGPGAPAAA